MANASHRTFTLPGAGAALLLASLLFPAAAAARDPLELIPAEALLTWKGRPMPEFTSIADSSSPLGALLKTVVNIAGNLKPSERLTLSLVEASGMLIQHDFAISLLDAAAAPIRPGGDVRADKLQIAAVVNTGGDHDRFLRLIQRVISEQTDSSSGVLQTLEAHGRTYYELHDARLAGWMRVAWGSIDDCFVVTLGEGVWPKIAAVAADSASGLGGEPWVQKIRKGYDPLPLIEVLLASPRLSARLDPFVQDRATGFLKSWQIHDIDLTHWAIGLEGRAVYFTIHGRRGERTQRWKFADTQPDAPTMNLIPDGARFGVVRYPIGEFLQRLIASIYATRPAAERDEAVRIWRAVQQEHGFDAERDILPNLGERLIFHNFPEHPLKLPIMLTTVAEVRGERQRVRQTLEKLCESWQTAVEKAAEESGRPAPGRLIRAEDGVWYFQISFFSGVAWKFLDGYIVASWHPNALREYLRVAGEALKPPAE